MEEATSSKTGEDQQQEEQQQRQQPEIDLISSTQEQLMKFLEKSTEKEAKSDETPPEVFKAFSVTSFHRKHPVLVYPTSNQPSLCLEFSWKRTNRDGTFTYVCVGCDSLRRKKTHAKSPVPSIRVSLDFNFMADPELLAHTCQAKALPQKLAKRQMLGTTTTLRSTSDSRVPSELKQDVVNQILENPVYRNMSEEDRQKCLAALTLKDNGRAAANFARQVQRNRKAQREKLEAWLARMTEPPVLP